jgi:hypothetical protein
MNKKIQPFRSLHLPLTVAVVIIILLNGCHKDDNNTTSDQYLVSQTQVTVFTLDAIQAMLLPLEPLYPQASGIKDHAQYSVQVFSIKYKTHYKGNEITASGLVCVPLSEETFPVISFQNGTNTLNSHAPTADPLNYNYLLLEAMASNGYVILIPDYIGFGASAGQVHPYYQKETTAETVIDMIHACGEMVGKTGVLAKINDTRYLMGYSQGGWATLATLEETEKNDHGMTVKAASCGAGAYDLMAMSNYVLALDTFPGPVYLPYFIYSEQEFGAIADPLSKFFNEPYATRIPSLFDGTHSNTDVDNNLNDTINRLLTADMIANFATGTSYAELRDVLLHNSVSGWDVQALVRFYHGTADMNVPPAQSQLIYNSFLSAGADPSKVTHLDIPDATHETGVIPWGISTINWFNELEGK